MICDIWKEVFLFPCGAPHHCKRSVHVRLRLDEHLHLHGRPFCVGYIFPCGNIILPSYIQACQTYSPRTHHSLASRRHVTRNLAYLPPLMYTVHPISQRTKAPKTHKCPAYITPTPVRNRNPVPYICKVSSPRLDHPLLEKWKKEKRKGEKTLSRV